MRQRKESSTQLAAHADRERQAKQDRRRIFWQQELAWQVDQPRIHENMLAMCRTRAGWDEGWWEDINGWLDEYQPDGTDQWWRNFAVYARAAQRKRQSVYDSIAAINGMASTAPLRQCKVAAKYIPNIRAGDPSQPQPLLYTQLRSPSTVQSTVHT